MAAFVNQFDLNLLKQRFNQTAASYANVKFPKIIAEDLLARLDDINIKPIKILDLGAGTGFMSEKLCARFPGSRVIALDLAEARLQQLIHPDIGRVCADMHQLPFKKAAFDLIISNLTLYWSDNPASLFTEIARILKPDGLFLFSTLGPDTLQELRASFAGVDQAAHVNSFLDLHDLGDSLLKAGFKDPVMDVDFYPVRFKALDQLFEFLKNQGETNALGGRSRYLFGRQKWAAMKAFYTAAQATFEVVFGHGIGQILAQSDGTIMIPLANIKKSKV